MNIEHTYGDKWWPNSCTKCSGAMHLCKDQFGQYRKCINCGRTDNRTANNLTVPKIRTAVAA